MEKVSEIIPSSRYEPNEIEMAKKINEIARAISNGGGTGEGGNSGGGLTEEQIRLIEEIPIIKFNVNTNIKEIQTLRELINSTGGNVDLTEIKKLLELKADKSVTYTKNEVDSFITLITEELMNYYNKVEINDKLRNKVDKTTLSNYYTTDMVYSKNEIDSLKPSLKGDKGDIGPKGDKGDAGIKGDMGNRGLQGLQGEVGPKGEIGPIGPKGDNGLIGPKGDTGLAGHIGPRGPKGDIGITGPKGDTGLAGPMGPMGQQGLAGPKGDKGDRGLMGLTGEVGPKGDNGLIGPKGDTGLAGPKGDNGLVGPTGLRGPKGDIGPIGPKGDIGLIGPKGDTGEPGLRGPKGDNGLAGIRGPKGDTGLAGPIGPKGDNGLDGIIGPKGDKGEPGLAGPKGDKGEQGLSGSSNWDDILNKPDKFSPTEHEHLDYITKASIRHMGSDLDNPIFRVGGNYALIYNESSLNFPINNDGKLVVIQYDYAGWVTQVFYSDNNKVYIRTMNSYNHDTSEGTWGNWDELIIGNGGNLNVTGRITTFNLSVTNYLECPGIVGTTYVKAPKGEFDSVIANKRNILEEIDALKNNSGGGSVNPPVTTNGLVPRLTDTPIEHEIYIKALAGADFTLNPKQYSEVDKDNNFSFTAGDGRVTIDFISNGAVRMTILTGSDGYYMASGTLGGGSFSLAWQSTTSSYVWEGIAGDRIDVIINGTGTGFTGNVKTESSEKLMFNSKNGPKEVRL